MQRPRGRSCTHCTAITEPFLKFLSSIGVLLFHVVSLTLVFHTGKTSFVDVLLASSKSSMLSGSRNTGDQVITTRQKWFPPMAWPESSMKHLKLVGFTNFAKIVSFWMSEWTNLKSTTLHTAHNFASHHLKIPLYIVFNGYLTPLIDWILD